MSEQTPGLTGWCIVELMGHIRLAGYVTEEEHFGAKIGRVDIPGPKGETVTQFFGGSSIYRITPTTEAIARRVAMHDSPAPVGRWDLALPGPQVRYGPNGEEETPFAEPDDDDVEDDEDVDDPDDRINDPRQAPLGADGGDGEPL